MLQRTPITVLIEVTQYTDVITLEKFMEMIQQAAPAILLPELEMLIRDYPHKPGFVILFKGEIGLPAWPKELTNKYSITVDSEERTVMFLIRNELHGDFDNRDAEVAKVALQQAIKG